MKEPKYLTIARSLIGTREIIGKEHNSLIIKWLKKLNAWWLEDETAWCGTFTAHCLKEAGHDIPKHWYRAKAYLDYGVKIDSPCVGCIVIFNRTGGGHVGFVIGKDYAGRLLVLGGNQNNQVSIAPFNLTRVAGYRIPNYFPYSTQLLPVISNSDVASENEA